VVKAFNYLYAELLQDAGALARVSPSIFYCGDQEKARETVRALVLSCGLDPVDCGPLVNARYLEPLAMLMVQLVRTQGWAPADVGMMLSRR
jgi:predicted dinucleotide-binding enzyme